LDAHACLGSRELIRSGRRQQFKCHRDKEHRRELELTVSATRDGRRSPIPFDELVEVT